MVEHGAGTMDGAEGADWTAIVESIGPQFRLTENGTEAERGVKMTLGIELG